MNMQMCVFGMIKFPSGYVQCETQLQTAILDVKFHDRRFTASGMLRFSISNSPIVYRYVYSEYRGLNIVGGLKPRDVDNTT